MTGGLFFHWLGSPAVDAMGKTLIHFIWQGAAAAAFIAVLLASLKTSDAKIRYAIACAGLLAMLIVPGATFALLLSRSSVPAGTTIRIEDASIATRTQIALRSSPPNSSGFSIAPTTPGTLRDVIRWLVVAWLAGVVVLSLRLLGGWHRLGSVRTQASPAATIWQARLAGIAERLGIHTAVRLLESFQIDAPCAIGWLKPVVLVPSAMLCEMAPAQLEAILAHELAHIWRNDYLVNLLQSVIEAVLFYHPAVWWISSRIRAERENCCDDLAIRMCGSRTDYARALMSLEDLRVSQMHLVPAATGSPLLARVRRIIVQAPTRRRASCWPAGLFVLATAVALSVAVACRPHNPSVVPTTTTTSTTPSSQPANSITGRVVDSEGKPVYQAVILLTPQQGNASSPLQRPRATDRDGRFHFDVVAGNYLLRAFSSDHRATRNATVAGPGQNVTIILEKNVSPVITGRVVDANGAPLRTPPRTGGFGGSRNPPPQTAPAWIGARVAIGIESVPGSGNYAVISRRPGELHSFTDDAGHFAIDAGFPDLRCCLIIEADGYVPVKTPLDGPYGIGQSRQLADIVLSKRGN